MTDDLTFKLYDQFDGSRGKVPLSVQRLEHLEMWMLLDHTPAKSNTARTAPAKRSSSGLRLARFAPPQDSESFFSESPRNERTADDTRGQSAASGEQNSPVEPLAIHWLLGLNASQEEDCGCDYQKTTGDEFHDPCLFVESN